MNTVNVLEMTGDTNILSLRSWEDNPEGNKEAEAVFEECITENDNESPTGTPTIERCIEDGVYECGDYKLFLIHSMGTTTMGNKIVPTECPPVINAECHSDDHNVEVQFDASTWFNRATADEIINLAECGWKNDYPADDVAIYMADFNDKIEEMFKYIELAGRNKSMGFECSINEDNALEWLKQHRPALYLQISSMEKE